MKIYKNFLSNSDFKKIKSIFTSDSFPWYFSDCVNKENDDFFQFNFIFYKEEKLNCSQEFLNFIKPILSKLKYKKLTRVKANLLVKTNKLIEHGYHTDQHSGETCIFYINNCNGYTKFKNNKIITSEENKLIQFDSKLEHTGSSCTDEKRRIVLNINYQ